MRTGDKYRRYLISVGRPTRVTGAEFDQIRGRLRAFKARGMTYEQMGAQVDLAANSVRFACTSRKGVFRPTADKLVQIRFDAPDPNAPVDLTGTRRRLQALRRAGYPLPWVAERMGMGKRSLWKVGVDTSPASYVLYSTSSAVAEMYADIESKSPADFGIEERVVTFVQTFAEKRGYAPPTCWDPDTIDDPEAVPEWTGACGTTRGLHLHYQERILPACRPCLNARPPNKDRVGRAGISPMKLKAVRELRGMSVRDVADKLGVHKDTYYYWETGRSTPYADRLDQLMDALSCNDVDILEDP